MPGRSAISDTESPQEEAPKRPERPPADGLEAVVEAHVDAAADLAHRLALREVDVELEHPFQRAQSVRIGGIDRQRAAAGSAECPTRQTPGSSRPRTSPPSPSIPCT